MYFIHNKHDIVSIEMMKSLPPDTVIIDLFTERDSGNYLDLKVSELPALVEELEYMEPEIKSEELTETEQIMQAMTDAELRDFEIQQGQEMLAQQMTDIELALIERRV